MSIFPKKPIEPGDMVIGTQRTGWNKNGIAFLERYFTIPVIVLEIKNQQALLYFEQSGPTWYDITKLEKVYVREEYTDRGLARD
jgi:phosphoribosylaminoimidazole (AIR) synthetase